MDNEMIYEEYVEPHCTTKSEMRRVINADTYGRLVYKKTLVYLILEFFVCQLFFRNLYDFSSTKNDYMLFLTSAKSRRGLYILIWRYYSSKKSLYVFKMLSLNFPGFIS